MEKKVYESFECEIIHFSNEDVVTTSGITATGNYNSVDGFWNFDSVPAVIDE